MHYVTIQDPEIDDFIAQGLTARQAEVFRFFFDQACANGYQPNYRDVMAALGIGSPHAVNGHVRALARKGWIGKAKGSARAIKFLRNPDGSPFRGLIPAPPA